jgi:hypothetical protein
MPKNAGMKPRPAWVTKNLFSTFVAEKQYFSTKNIGFRPEVVYIDFRPKR